MAKSGYATTLNTAVARCKRAKTRKVCNQAIQTATNKLWGKRRAKRKGSKRSKGRKSIKIPILGVAV